MSDDTNDSSDSSDVELEEEKCFEDRLTKAKACNLGEMTFSSGMCEGLEEKMKEWGEAHESLYAKVDDALLKCDSNALNQHRRK